MAESEESDDHRLAGRMPRHMRAPGPDDDPSADEEDDGEDGENQLDAVNRLLGFLRSTD
jgi:hypothetical protein